VVFRSISNVDRRPSVHANLEMAPLTDWACNNRSNDNAKTVIGFLGVDGKKPDSNKDVQEREHWQYSTTRTSHHSRCM
jgi:hypothetical protein